MNFLKYAWKLFITVLKQHRSNKAENSSNEVFPLAWTLPKLCKDSLAAIWQNILERDTSAFYSEILSVLKDSGISVLHSNHMNVLELDSSLLGTNLLLNSSCGNWFA